MVYSMTTISDSMQCVDISDLFPYPTSVFSPKVNLVGLSHEREGQVLLHDVNVRIIDISVLTQMGVIICCIFRPMHCFYWILIGPV